MTALPYQFTRPFSSPIAPQRRLKERPRGGGVFRLPEILPSRRESRITILIGSFVILSALDLVLTVGHICTIGLFEDNPIIVWLAHSTGSWIAIASYKSFTVAVTSAILFRLRKYRSAEFGAWVCVLVLTLLALVWIEYLNEIRGIDPQLLAVVGGMDTD